MAEYIERNLLLKGVDGNIQNMRANYGGNTIANYAINLVQLTRDYIAAIPAADVVPVVYAKWIDGEDSFGAKRGQYRVCSRCNICFPHVVEVAAPYWQHCPNCGARMDGE